MGRASQGHTEIEAGDGTIDNETLTRTVKEAEKNDKPDGQKSKSPKAFKMSINTRSGKSLKATQDALGLGSSRHLSPKRSPYLSTMDDKDIKVL